MHPYVLIPLFAGLAAAMLATAILARDAQDRAHRLAAAILGCAAYWSILEVVWNTRAEPDWVPQLVRLSSLGWMPLGVLCCHLLLELGADRGGRLRPRLPWLYGGTALLVLLYVGTPWGVAGVVRTGWGWSFRYGPLFLWLYLPVAALASLSMTVLWWRAQPRNAARSEVRQWVWGCAAMGAALVSASCTDALLPWFGIHVPRLGSASITLVGGVIAWSTLRYGHSVLAPGTYAPQILATLRDGVALLRPDGIVRFANASLARICGCAREELLGRPLADFLPGLAVGISGDLEELGCQLVSRNGDSISVSLSSAILRDREGAAVGQVISVRDVREVMALRNRLLLAGRLAAVGELAAGIAHEINNPIAFVRANLNQLEKQWEAVGARLRTQGDPGCEETLREGHELIEESLVGVSRVASIVQDVRGFAQAGTERDTLADVNDLLEISLRMAAPRLRRGVRLERHFGALPPVRGDIQELKQAFLNLILNAADAVGEEGTIRLTTCDEEGHVVVSVQDDGRGIAPAVCDRIFDPFFTTKPAGEGLGLGLSLSYETVRRHGGDIELESRPGAGSCFRIRLPAEPAA